MATVPSSSLTPTRGHSPQTPRRLPPLEQGDRLTRSEFLKRYAAMPPKVKAERIEGIVYMPAAAVSAEFHGQPHAHMIGWLFLYESMTPGVVTADNSTIALDIDNDPQPDACLRILPSHGGRAKLSPDGYIEGSPELVVEIAASSMSYDLGAKLNTYRRNGVREYIVHRTYDGEIDWFVLRDDQYARLSPDAQGVIHSEVFPGLWLATEALIAGRPAEVLSVLQQGIASAEHGDFVKKLGNP
jgi:Uma2 family endonuclease